MSHWTEGYVTGLDYVYSYQPDLSPSRLPLYFLNAGLVTPTIQTACELGFGQGVTANVHAAGSTVEWYGTDFNAAHTAFARELAAASGAKASFFDESFAEFCSRKDLPDFDFIVMHGVWSWISDENRLVLVDFLSRKLKVGGVLYVSYNVQPGFAAMIPLQEIMGRHAQSMGAPGRGFSERIDGALDFVEQLLAASPGYVGAHSRIASELRGIRGGDRSYLAHEYFNRNWVPTSFARVAEWLAPAKLDYACSANYFHTVDTWNVHPDQVAFLSRIEDPIFRETVRDFMTTQTFRMDYWVKGARKLSAMEKLEGVLKQRVVLIRPRSEVKFKVVGALGEFALLESVAAPILDSLADHQPRSLQQIAQAVRERRIAISQVLDVVLAFMRMAVIVPVQDESVSLAARAQTDRLNAFLCERARVHAGVGVLASPLTGGGVADAEGRVVQFFLNAMSQGKRQPAELAAHASQTFQMQELAILRDGKPLDSVEEGLEALNKQASWFLETQLPMLKALHVV